VLDVIRGGELFDRIIEQESFSEEDACAITAQLVNVTLSSSSCGALVFDYVVGSRNNATHRHWNTCTTRAVLTETSKPKTFSASTRPARKYCQQTLLYSRDFLFCRDTENNNQLPFFLFLFVFVFFFFFFWFFFKKISVKVKLADFGLANALGEASKFAVRAI
jgi:serine/threonine protein kinase